MTALGRAVLLIAISGLFAGLIRGQAAAAALSLATLFWLMLEWVWFQWRVRYQVPRLTFQRVVNDRDDSEGTLQAGRLLRAQVLIGTGGTWCHGPFHIEDVIPENVDVAQSEHQAYSGPGFRSAVFCWTARVRGAGQLRLPGFRIVVQDRHGFFRSESFVVCRQIFRVLPAWLETGEHRPVIKRINAIPRHGIHRLQRAGMGSELLELRDYVIGDPPKSIAWKVSARRDRLMTRQYESEVPIRVQLFVDGGISMRVGGFGSRLLDQVCFVAASVARNAVSAGDSVGLVCFDERGPRVLGQQTGDRGFQQLLQAMADFAVNPPPMPTRLTPQLEQSALALMGQQFPHLLNPRINYLPWSLFPLLPWRRRRHQQRGQLASAIAQLYGMTAERQMQLMLDDALLATFSQHFLSQCGMAWLAPVVAIRGRGFHDGVARMEALSQAVLTAVSRAKDNEVLVILADLLESSHGISHLLPALRLARARHHRVVCVCPTPTFRRPVSNAREMTGTSADELLLAAEPTRTSGLANGLHRELRRLGVATAFAGEASAIHAVLSEMDLARSGRAGAGVSR
ncbi:MAG: DUF58 domain-containing protein [Planctomyces sp.]